MKFSVEKRQQYDKDMITERDWENIKQTARREGREEGRIEGREEGHREGLERGLAEGRAEGREEGRAEGLTEGREEGRAEERLAVARNLKALGVSLTDIAKATGLTHEEIEAL